VKHRVFTTIFTLMACPYLWGQTTWFNQVHDSLQSTLVPMIDGMAQELQLDSYETGIEITYLDRRLNFAVCNKPIEVDTPSPLPLGRVHVKVQCRSNRPWALNVPVQINLTTEVVVTNQPLPRGVTIKPQHLDKQMTNLADLRNGYFLKKDLVIGKQSKRALSGQTILNEHLVLPALMVRKGDRVMIMAKKGAMNVKMPGEALNNGREGRQIRVKNVRSQRIVKGKVVAPGLVLVNF